VFAALASLEKTFGSDHLALCEFLDKTAELAQVGLEQQLLGIGKSKDATRVDT
jgi:hypothetical protein